MNDLFSCAPKVAFDETSKNTNDFKPNPSKTATGVYKAVIKFLPNPADPVNKSIISKNTVRLTNPTTNESRYVDCPSSVGKPDPIVDTFFKLRNSDNAVKQEQSKMFSRKQRYSSLIQVISCESDPTLNNKILVWTYGLKVYGKIASEMTSPMPGIPAKNPFDLLNGRVFIVSAKMMSGYPNYDDCQFVDTDEQTRAFRIGVPQADGSMSYMPITADFISNEKGRAAVTDFLVKNSPDLAAYEYHDWDDDTASFVTNIINMYLSNQTFTIPQASDALNKTVNMGQHVRTGSTAPNANDLAAIMNGTTTSAPAAPSAPAQGLSLGLNSVPGSQPSNEGFDVNTLGVSGLDNILNSGMNNAAPQETASSASLDDLLNGTFF